MVEYVLDHVGRDFRIILDEFRFEKTNVNKNCQLCNSDDLGDEFHYLFICNIFKDERKLLLNEYYYKRPNTMKMNELFNICHLKTQINLSKFVKMILDKFK